MNIDKKIERFNQKYKDKGGYAQLLKMIEGLATLDQIGKHFGFSRQNSAGIYKSFFDKNYGEIQKRRRLRRQMDMLNTCCDLGETQKFLEDMKKFRSAKKIGYIRLVKKVAEDHGHNVVLKRKRSGALEVFINGYKCSISGSETQTIYHYPQNHPPSVYYRFAISTKNVDFCIFVLELKDHYTLYIIPYEKIRHLTLITLKDNYQREKGRRGNTSSKYAIYKNRWDLLAKPKPNPEYEEELKALQELEG